MSYLDRIVIQSIDGTNGPRIRGLGTTVGENLSRLFGGQTWEQILEAYPGIASEDLRACLEYVGIPDGEWLVWENSSVRRSLERGIADAEAGRVHGLGSFSRFLDEPD